MPWDDSVMQRNRLQGLSAVLAIALGFSSPAYADSRAERLMEAAKQAAGGASWDGLTGLHETGKLVAGGLQGHYETWVDVSDRRDVATFALGPASGAQGWDGRQAWSTDSSGDLRVETSNESIAAALQTGYRTSYGFFFPTRAAAEVEYAGGRGDHFEAVKVTPTGAQPFEVWLDVGTHLLAREVQLGGAEPHSFIFSDWRRVGPIRLPFRVIERAGDDPSFDQVRLTASVDLARDIPAKRFAAPTAVTRPADWPPGQASVTVPFTLINNHIYVLASIDAGRPQPVIFDTGATDILDTRHAAALGIATVGSLPVGGIGSTITPYGFARVKRISIGGLTLRNQVFGAIDLAWLPRIEGADSFGLVGYEFAKRAVITIDYARHLLTFTKASAFRAPPEVAAVPFTFHEHSPLIAAVIDGVPGQFELDTGARTGLVVMGPFAKEHGLVVQERATRLATVSYGVGGPARALVARIAVLTIGPVTLNAPVAAFAVSTGGDAAASYIAGNIGGDLLKRFTVTLDYGHQRLWLQPNASAGVPEVFDRSGLWISRAADGGIAIDDVASGSAASSAHLEKGDEITAVDGSPAAQVALDWLREHFMAPPGTHVQLSVKHGGETRTCDVVLADQV